MVKNIFIIILISVFLAAVFNYVSPNSIPWFPEPEEFASDSLLDAGADKLDTEAKDGEFPSVTYNQVISRLENPDFVFIDARPSHEFEEDRIPGAINMDPYGDEDLLMQTLFEVVPPGKKYIIYCHGGNCDLSHMVAERMKNFGFENLFIFTGGWEVWTKERGKS